MAHLEGLMADMPSITQNRMRLAPMTGQQALAVWALRVASFDGRLGCRLAPAARCRG